MDENVFIGSSQMEPHSLFNFDILHLLNQTEANSNGADLNAFPISVTDTISTGNTVIADTGKMERAFASANFMDALAIRGLLMVDTAIVLAPTIGGTLMIGNAVAPALVISDMLMAGNAVVPDAPTDRIGRQITGHRSVEGYCQYDKIEDLQMQCAVTCLTPKIINDKGKGVYQETIQAITSVLGGALDTGASESSVAATCPTTTTMPLVGVPGESGGGSACAVTVLITAILGDSSELTKNKFGLLWFDKWSDEDMEEIMNKLPESVAKKLKPNINVTRIQAGNMVNIRDSPNCNVNMIVLSPSTSAQTLERLVKNVMKVSDDDKK